MKPFLKSIAEYIYMQYQEDIHSLALVFPNKRARIFFNKYLAEVADKPTFTPKYYTINEFMQELSGQIIADQITLLFDLFEVYSSVTGSTQTFDNFLFYCEMLLADFDDIDKYLVNADMLYSNLKDIKDIEIYTDYLNKNQKEALEQFWKIFLESKNSDEKEKFHNLWNVLSTIYKEYNLKLDDKNYAYEGKAFRKAITALEDTKTEIEANKVAFIGFNALNKCEKRLFAYLKNQKKALFFWDYDDYYMGKAQFHEAAYFLKDYLHDFPPPENFNFETGIEEANKEIRIFDIPSTIGQAKALEQMIKHFPDDWMENPIQSTIALADESLLIPVLNSIPPQVEEINISMGYPLKETQIFSLFGLLTELHKNKRISKEGKTSFYHIDIKRIMQHGLISSGNENVINLFLRNLEHLNMIYAESELFEPVSDLISQIFQPEINSKNFTTYLISILESLSGFSLINDHSGNVIEQEAAFRIISQLRRLNDIFTSSHIEYSFKSLLRLIEKIIVGVTIPFSGEPLSGLQVMGILETRTLDFENLIILSMNEGVFPKSGNVPTFIPYTLRKGFELPTIEHQDAIFAYYFYRLLQRSKTICLVYASSVKDMNSGEPSRFIQQLLFDNTFNIKKSTLGYEIFPLKERKISVEISEETINILQRKYLDDNGSLLTPSAINTYLNCTLRFYFRYIANVPEPEIITEDIEANVFGNILHKTMEKLYKKLGRKIISKHDLINLLKDKKTISKELDNTFREEFISTAISSATSESGYYTGKNLIVKEVIYRYILNIIEYDIFKAPLKIIDLEKRVFSKFQVDKNKTANLGGIIDRIDDRNNTIHIIDYKTGRTKNSFSTIQSMFYDEPSKRNDAAFQIFLYSLIVSKERNTIILPELYFVREIKNKEYNSYLKVGENRSKSTVKDISPMLGEFEAFLKDTLQNIFKESGTYEQTDDIKYCSYCPYIRICGRESLNSNY